MAVAVSGKEELACTYAALILHDEGVGVTADKIRALVKAANIEVAAYWPGLFEKLLKGKNIDDLLLNAGGGGGGGGAPVAAAGSSAPAGKDAGKKDDKGGKKDEKGGKKEEKKEEKKKEEAPPAEEEADMGLSLFD